MTVEVVSLAGFTLSLAGFTAAFEEQSPRLGVTRWCCLVLTGSVLWIGLIGHMATWAMVLSCLGFLISLVAVALACFAEPEKVEEEPLVAEVRTGLPALRPSGLRTEGHGMTRIASDNALAETDRAPRPMRADPGPLFGSVVCVVDRSSTGYAARQQAAALAPGGEVEYISPSQPWSANSTLLDRCDGAGLLVLGARYDAGSLIERASLPVLLTGWCPSGANVTDRILVVVDDEADPHNAAEVAGRLASRYGGSVAVVPAPKPNRALERATAATSRIVLQAAGMVPRVLGGRVPFDRTILSAAASMDASLLVLPLANTQGARRRTASICAARRLLGAPDPRICCNSRAARSRVAGQGRWTPGAIGPCCSHELAQPQRDRADLRRPRTDPKKIPRTRNATSREAEDRAVPTKPTPGLEPGTPSLRGDAAWSSCPCSALEHRRVAGSCTWCLLRLGRQTP